MKFIVLIYLMLLGTSLFSQSPVEKCDTLRLHNGEELIVSLVSLSEEMLKFRDCPDSNNKLHSDQISVIRAQDIVMINSDSVSTYDLEVEEEACDSALSPKEERKVKNFKGATIALTAGGFVALGAGGVVGYEFYKKSNEGLIHFGVGNLTYLVAGVTAASIGVNGATALWIVGGVMDFKRKKILGRKCK